MKINFFINQNQNQQENYPKKTKKDPRKRPLKMAAIIVGLAVVGGVSALTTWRIARDNEKSNQKHIDDFRRHSREDAARAQTFPVGSMCHQEYTLKATEWTRQAQLCEDWKDRTILGKAFGTTINEYNALNTVERMAAAVVQSQPIPSRAEGAQ